jgi:hypothetical protein
VPLLPEDAAFLSDRRIEHEVHEDGAMTCVILRGWTLPAGLDRAEADVLLRLPPGYPDVAPDMWWVDPPVCCASGEKIPATQSVEVHLGQQWQRWSRHFAAGQWQAGIDHLENFIALMSAEFRRSAQGAA